ncbi:MAG: Rrf2 family transcriptional regulator [Mariprofundaceae bacterium]
MRLTTRGQYAVSAMVDLSRHQAEGPVTLGVISERQYISLSYLEQLFRRLRENGLVRSVRGPGGGYLLNNQASDISVADVIRAVDEPIRTTVCRDAMPGCHNGKRCATHNLWISLRQHIFRFLDVVSLEDVTRGRVSLADIELSPIEENDSNAETGGGHHKIAAVSGS